MTAHSRRGAMVIAILQWVLPRAMADEACGDLFELFDRRVQQKGLARARIRLWMDVASLLRCGLAARARRGYRAFPDSSIALVSGLPGDLRSALRLARTSPSFSALAVLIFALGIGANTAVFSLVNAMLLQPIATTAPGIVGIYSQEKQRPDEYRAFSYDVYQTIRAAGPPFADVMAHTITLIGLTEGNATRRSFAALVSASYFSTLGVPLAMGRPFTPDEERPGSDLRVVIVGHAYWKRTGARSDALGTLVRLNGRDYTIVGVTPEGFGGTMAIVAPEFWLPTGVFDRVADDIFRQNRAARLADPSTRGLMLVGRLTDGVDSAGAEPALALMSSRLQAIGGSGDPEQRIVVRKLSRISSGTDPQTDAPVAGLSALLMGMAALVLLISCLNLANMLLARGTSRRREIAVRLAVGGTRFRVIRQLLVESLALSLAGGAAGVLLAIWGARALVTSIGPALPIVVTFDGRPDMRVLIATLTFAVASTIVAALGPAWRASRPELLPDLKDQPSMVAGIRGFSTRNAMVAGQLALSLALLVGAGLLIRGAATSVTADPGFVLDRGVVMGINPEFAGYDEQRSRAVIARVMERVRALPGIASASLASTVPFGDERDGRPVVPAGPDATAVDAAVSATYTVVGAQYFETLGVPLLEGREFTDAEERSAGGTPAAVIDVRLAQRLFGEEHAVGRSIRFARDSDSGGVVMEVVGVVGTVRDTVIGEGGPHVYVPLGQASTSAISVHARVAASADAAVNMLSTMRRAITALDPELPIVQLRTLEQQRDASLAVWAVKTIARLFSAFGLIALLIAVIGVYGLKAYAVSSRTREIGVRLALGATPASVLSMMLREGLLLMLIGMAVGLVLAVGIGRLLSGLLYEVSPTDPMVFGGAIAVLGVGTLAATYLPARRATRVTAARALRME